MLKQALSTAGGALRTAVLTRVNLAPTTPFTLQVRVPFPVSHPLLYHPTRTPHGAGKPGAALGLPHVTYRSSPRTDTHAGRLGRSVVPAAETPASPLSTRAALSRHNRAYDIGVARRTRGDRAELHPDSATQTVSGVAGWAHGCAGGAGVRRGCRAVEVGCDGACDDRGESVQQGGSQ